MPSAVKCRKIGAMTVAATPNVRYVVRPDPQAIKTRRYALGIGGKELATRVGVTPGCISHIESGKRSASPALLKRIADALDRTVDQISTVHAVEEDTG